VVRTIQWWIGISLSTIFTKWDLRHFVICWWQWIFTVYLPESRIHSLNLSGIRMWSNWFYKIDRCWYIFLYLFTNMSGENLGFEIHVMRHFQGFWDKLEINEEIQTLQLDELWNAFWLFYLDMIDKLSMQCQERRDEIHRIESIHQ
jgi:hypothetical protein